MWTHSTTMAKSMELWGTSILTAQDPFACLTTSPQLWMNGLEKGGGRSRAKESKKEKEGERKKDRKKTWGRDSDLPQPFLLRSYQGVMLSFEDCVPLIDGQMASHPNSPKTDRGFLGKASDVLHSSCMRLASLLHFLCLSLPLLAPGWKRLKTASPF